MILILFKKEGFIIFSIYLLDTSQLFQWDLNRKIKIFGKRNIDEVHFCHAGDEEALIVPVKQENNILIANIPNILLQGSADIWYYLVAEGKTLKEGFFSVNNREKPSEYIYEETEILNYAALEKRLQKIEEDLKNFKSEETDPTIPDWAKQPEKPKYTAGEVGAAAVDEVIGLINFHNTAGNSHNDLRVRMDNFTSSLNNKANKNEIPQIYDWAKQQNKPTYTAKEVGAPTLTNFDKLTTRVSNVEAAKADWDEFNEDSLGYIKNKPFYYHEDNSKILFEDENAHFTAAMDWVTYNLPDSTFLVEGTEYNLQLDDYIFQISYGNSISIDNSLESLFGYTLSFQYGGISLYNGGNERTFHLRIDTIGQGIIFKELDEKFIPYKPGKKINNGGEIFNDYTNNIASGIHSHAEGQNNKARGRFSHAEGLNTEAKADVAHTEGEATISYTVGSHAEGKSTQAGGNGTNTGGSYAHAEGVNTIALARGSHAEGESTLAQAQFSHAEGGGCQATGAYSHAEGCNDGNSKVTSSGMGSHAEGRGTTSSGNASHAEGKSTTASGEGSHAEGLGTIAEGDYSHAEGCSNGNIVTAASGKGSHAEGIGNWAIGKGSHAEGINNSASRDYSHAEGDSTTASGIASHTEGKGTIANSSFQHVQGKFNIEDTENRYAHIVGNGSSVNARSNAHTVDWGGNAEFKGDVVANGCGGENSVSLVELSERVNNLQNQSGGQQADWNQNDETQLDYVKNKPFYSYIDNTTKYAFTNYFKALNPAKKAETLSRITDKKAYELLLLKSFDSILAFTAGADWNIAYSHEDEDFVYYTDQYENFIEVSKLEPILYATNPRIAENQDALYLESIALQINYRDEIIKQLDEKYIPDNIPKIATATIGQTLEIESVDEDGKPTKWKAVDKPTGEDIDLSEYVKNTDYATSSKAGIVMVKDSTYGLKLDNGKEIRVVGASKKDIDEKSGNRPIKPTELDYAVKSGLTTNSLEWTEEEKKSARDLIGVPNLETNVDVTTKNITHGENISLFDLIETYLLNIDYDTHLSFDTNEIIFNTINTTSVLGKAVLGQMKLG